VHVEVGFMRHADQSFGEATALLDAGRDVDALAVLRRLAGETDDPVLRHELDELLASGRASSRGFRKAWDRLQVAYFVGR
jgi:hypothetical protein